MPRDDLAPTDRDVRRRLDLLTRPVAGARPDDGASGAPVWSPRDPDRVPSDRDRALPDSGPPWFEPVRSAGTPVPGGEGAGGRAEDESPAGDVPGADAEPEGAGRVGKRPGVTGSGVTSSGGAGERTSGALRSAVEGYGARHGHPLDWQPPVRRLRWSLSWRAASAAALALAIVAGGVVLRAASMPDGPVVAIPDPSPPDDPAPGGGAGGVDGVPGGAGAVAETQAGTGTGGPGPAGTGTGGLVPVGTGGAAAGPSDAALPDGGSSGQQVTVHVVGAVVSPGVVLLPLGARVDDAVRACGGATADADLAALNLARLLVDGEQVVVPRPGEEPVAAPGAAAGPDPAAAPGDPRVDVNTADAAALDALPGIGPVLAERIVARREERPFRSVDELLDVSGIGPAVLERLRDLVRV